ncbi:Uncharacterised protein [Mycobacteroides abscessus subsp. abscessus]|nr:Uncharacterised protein [Mycobacteroides abscessus subsp. abscessus]
MDAVALVQGVSGGISDTADAVGSGASIASTWLNEAGQGAQLAADANPQLKAEAEQVRQLTQAGSQVADLTGKVAGGVSQVSGMVSFQPGHIRYARHLRGHRCTLGDGDRCQRARRCPQTAYATVCAVAIALERAGARQHHHSGTPAAASAV